MLKDNNKDTRKTSLTSLWCLYCLLWTDLTLCSGTFIADFEQVNAGWDLQLWLSPAMAENKTAHTFASQPLHKKKLIS